MVSIPGMPDIYDSKTLYNLLHTGFELTEISRRAGGRECSKFSRYKISSAPIASRSSTPVGFMNIVASIVDHTFMAEGVIAASSQCLEGAAVEGAAQYVEVLPFGLSIGPRAWHGSELEGGEIKTCLDSKAAKSVLFISFGSVWA